MTMLVVSMPSTMYRFSAALAPSIMIPPPDFVSMFAPGACDTSVVKSRPCGTISIRSERMLVERVLWETSTRGDSAVTVTLSATLASAKAKSTFFTCPRLTGTSLCFLVVKPCSVAVIWTSPAGAKGSDTGRSCR